MYLVPLIIILVLRYYSQSSSHTQHLKQKNHREQPQSPQKRTIQEPLLRTTNSKTFRGLKPFYWNQNSDPKLLRYSYNKYSKAVLYFDPFPFVLCQSCWYMSSYCLYLCCIYFSFVHSVSLKCCLCFHFKAIKEHKLNYPEKSTITKHRPPEILIILMQLQIENYAFWS